MSIVLEAYAPTQGMAIIRISDMIRLIQPPYQERWSTQLSERAVADAISKAGYISCNKVFLNYAELIEFLNSEVVASREAIGRPVPESVDQDILDVAPKEVLVAFLDRVEAELIPDRKFDQAESLLIPILRTHPVVDCRELASRALNLLDLNRRLRLEAQAKANIPELTDVRFQSLRKRHQVERCTHLANHFRLKGCLLGA
jgi:hypothetical protein